MVFIIVKQGIPKGVELRLPSKPFMSQSLGNCLGSLQWLYGAMKSSLSYPLLGPPKQEWWLLLLTHFSMTSDQETSPVLLPSPVLILPSPVQYPTSLMQSSPMLTILSSPILFQHQHPTTNSNKLHTGNHLKQKSISAITSRRIKRMRKSQLEILFMKELFYFAMLHLPHMAGETY